EKMEHVGSVIEIFGPVKKPYVSVKIKKHLDGKIPVGTVLYTIQRKPTNVRQKKKQSKKSRYKH
ncbi:MAG: H/ACA RNA-protein complex protein Gar1, partial [Candidatus Heimdallarchaeaceae archaeon]